LSVKDVSALPALPVARLLRLVVVAVILVAVVATWAETASRTTINPFNFFGYFTVQSNLLLAAVYLVVVLARSQLDVRTLTTLGACATTSIVIVGLVYATLLAPLGAEGGVPLPWANTVLHVVTPLYGIVDWLAFRDRVPLALNRLWVVLLYPLVWLAAVLVRGATDGWVPYPFLDPAHGYTAVAVICIGIFAAFLLVGGLVFWASQLGQRRPLAKSTD
jgi:DMSO/TMAO reductase YedYZ heme-binding membrane subunit